MKVFSLIVLVFLVAALMVAGCTGQKPAALPTTPVSTPAPAAPVAAAPAASLVPQQLTGYWTLTTMGIQGGTAVTHPTTEISLTINPDGTLTGYDGCNNYFASFALTGITTPVGQGMTISNVSQSKKYCQNLASQEQQYLNILSKTSAYVVDGTQLSLTGEMGDVLIYQRPATLVTPKEGPQPA
jgi:heat shock protein HslJ